MHKLKPTFNLEPEKDIRLIIFILRIIFHQFLPTNDKLSFLKSLSRLKLTFYLYMVKLIVILPIVNVIIGYPLLYDLKMHNLNLNL